MDLLIPFVLKSFLLAAAALLLLRLFPRRSAAARSVIAHFSLLALVLVPMASSVLPPLQISAPGPAIDAGLHVPTGVAFDGASATTINVTPAVAAPDMAGSVLDWALLGYALPAIGLLLIILLAVGRLFALRARADKLVDFQWHDALVLAEHRMGFTRGTVLLVSDELPSPISWGIMRPVIVLNQEALRSPHAEAIIAHELAHLARLDWAKLLLARLATALYWFNPFVWMLAREAHQLREETADDAVLAANIDNTDYAQLLVGVARHRGKGFLLAAHGVAPSRKSLARRVQRVLDATSARGPVARSFAAGVGVIILAVATPMAALTFDGEPAPVQTVENANSGQWLDMVQATDQGFRMGNPNAPVKLVLYGSRTCPICGALGREAMRPLEEQYVSTGEVSYEFRDFIVHGPVDMAASVLGRCVGARVFFPVLEQMFADQPAYLERLAAANHDRIFIASIEDKPPATVATAWAEKMGLFEFFNQRGMTEDKARACLNDDKALNKLVNIVKDNSASGLVQGTPTFLINDRPVKGVFNWQTLEQALNRAGAHAARSNSQEQAKAETRPENVSLFVKRENDGSCGVYWGQTRMTSKELRDRASAKLKSDFAKAGGIKNAKVEDWPEVRVQGESSVPYRCIGGTVFTMQVAGYPKVGFISMPGASPEPEEAIFVPRMSPTSVHPVSNKLGVAANGTISWNGTAIDLQRLRAYLDRTARMAPEPELLIQPDAEAHYARVDRVLAEVKRAKVTKLGFVGNEQYYNKF